MPGQTPFSTVGLKEVAMFRIVAVEREFGSGGGALPANWPAGSAGSCGTSN